MLNKIFLKSYAGFKWNGSAYVPELLSSTTVNYSDYSNISPPFNASNNNCFRNREDLSSFCAIYPTLTNVNLYYGSNSIPFVNNVSNTSSVTINTKGIYRLQFNSLVDAEQQPLKKIEIDWGDGYKQTINGQDHRPNAGSPHVFYHNYTKVGPTQIKVKITDNWGFFGENK